MTPERPNAAASAGPGGIPFPSPRRLPQRASAGGVPSLLPPPPPRTSKAGSDVTPTTPSLDPLLGHAHHHHPHGHHHPHAAALRGPGQQSAPAPSTPREGLAGVPPQQQGGAVMPTLSAGMSSGLGGGAPPPAEQTSGQKRAREELEGSQGELASAWAPADAGSMFSTLVDTYQQDQFQMSKMLATCVSALLFCVPLREGHTAQFAARCGGLSQAVLRFGSAFASPSHAGRCVLGAAFFCLWACGRGACAGCTPRCREHVPSK